MLQSLALDVVLALLVCAAVLGLIALYFRYTDPSAIDEEAEREVQEETPEEREEALRRQALREAEEKPADFESYL